MPCLPYGGPSLLSILSLALQLRFGRRSYTPMAVEPSVNMGYGNMCTLVRKVNSKTTLGKIIKISEYFL